MHPDPSIAVIYIFRGEYDPEFYERFRLSWRMCNPGVKCSLFVVRDKPEIGVRRESLGDEWHIDLPDVGFDIGKYIAAARMLFGHEYICCLNSKTEILAGNWLRYLHEAVSARRVGIAGATASWQEGLGRKFPNPHIRTNGFMIRRELFLDVAGNKPWWSYTKDDCNNFEHGPNGLTAQIMRKGLRPMLVDRHGTQWPVEKWPEARCWRVGNQEGLMLADNRTREYDELDHTSRCFLRGITWHADGLDATTIVEREKARRNQEVTSSAS